jgi:hypothetical protein
MIANSTSDAGKIILDYILINKISRASLSRKLGVNYESIYRMLKQAKMNTLQIEAFSRALQHDFFIDFSNLLPTDYHRNLNPNLELETRVVELEEDLKQLRFERDILMKVING